jgi:hypothetical protein
MKPKTIREWFLWADAQGYEWAPKAMQNLILKPAYDKDRASAKVSYLYQALCDAFIWQDSPEGNTFWIAIYEKLTTERI